MDHVVHSREFIYLNPLSWDSYSRCTNNLTHFSIIYFLSQPKGISQSHYCLVTITSKFILFSETDKAVLLKFLYKTSGDLTKWDSDSEIWVQAQESAFLASFLVINWCGWSMDNSEQPEALSTALQKETEDDSFLTELGSSKKRFRFKLFNRSE